MISTYVINFILGVGCNLNCDYCFNYNSIKNTRTSLFNLSALDVQFSRLRNAILNIGGLGEPCLHPQLMSIILLACKYDMKINIVSNGILFKQKFLMPLVKSPMNLRKLNLITLSYHHKQLSVNQRIDFIELVELVHKYVAHKLNVTVVLDDNAIDNLDEIQCVFNGSCISPIYQFVSKSYTSKHGIQSRAYSNEQLERIRDASIYVYESDTDFPYTHKSCMSGYKTFTVQPNGDVYDCDYDITNRLLIGNMNNSESLLLSDKCRICTATITEQGNCCAVNRGVGVNL